MARMHSDGRGSSGSSPPMEKKEPRWMERSGEEVRELVVQLAEKGNDPSEIGRRLRDQYAIPDVKTVVGDSVTEILEEEGLLGDLPEDLRNLVDRAERLQEHIDENPADGQAERTLELTKARIRRLADYHRDEGNIQEDWEF